MLTQRQDGENLSSLKEYYEFFSEQVLSLVRLLHNTKDPLEAHSLVYLLIIDIHLQSVLSHLVQSHCQSNTSLEWIRQLRYDLSQFPHSVSMR